MAVPNIFGTATSAIPLSQLDTNFATPVTIGNTAVQLGNTVTSFGNVTLTNVTISSGNVTLTGANVSGTANVSTLIVTGNATIAGTATTIQGLTVGRGAGAVATNTAVGASALAANQAGGTNNTAIGNAALDANTTGDSNTAVGDEALGANTTASNNTAVGYQAMYSNTTASRNTAVGYQAGYTNSTGQYNTFSGYQAGYLATGSGNTLIGYASGVSITTGTSNTFIGANSSGQGSGEAVTTGSKNTIIGAYSGNQGGLDIRTASNYIVLSDGDGNPRGIFDNSGNLLVGTTSSLGGRINASTSTQSFAGWFQQTQGAGSSVLLVEYNAAAPNSASDYFGLLRDNSAQRIQLRSNGGIGNFSANDVNLSDRREKTNFTPAKSYLDVICAIPVQTFNYIDQNMEDDGGLTLGVVAQDVQAVAPELVMESNWASKDEEPKIRLSIYQTDLQYALMKCIQELKAEVDSLKAQLNGASA